VTDRRLDACICTHFVLVPPWVSIPDVSNTDLGLRGVQIERIRICPVSISDIPYPTQALVLTFNTPSAQALLPLVVHKTPLPPPLVDCCYYMIIVLCFLLLPDKPLPSLANALDVSIRVSDHMMQLFWG